MQIETFYKRPIPVEMFKFTDENYREVVDHILGFGVQVYYSLDTKRLHHKDWVANNGDWIAQDVDGNFYPIPESVKEKTYFKNTEEVCIERNLYENLKFSYNFLSALEAKHVEEWEHYHEVVAEFEDDA